MSNGSGITPIPPSGGASSPHKGVVIQLVSLPEALQNNARALRIEGEVVQQNRDGSVRIKTREGDIDVNMRGKQPQAGQKIEIDIPAGSPPRNATMRPAPAQPQSPSQQPPQPSSPPPQDSTIVSTPPPATRPAPPPPTGVTPPAQPLPPAQSGKVPIAQNPATPVHVKPDMPAAATQAPPQNTPNVLQPPTQAPVASAKPAAPSLPLLKAGQIVTFVPMPVTPETAITQKTMMQTNILSQKAGGNLITALLQAVKSALPQSVSHSTSLTQSVPVTAPALENQMPVLSAKIISLVLPSGEKISMPLTPPMQVAPQLQTQAPAPAPTLAITISQLNAQNQPILSIPMNADGAVKNFVLQSPPASVPVGTQITLQPQITLQNLVSQPAQNTIAPLPVLTPTLPSTGMSQPSQIPISPLALSSLPPAWRAAFPLMQAMPFWPAFDDIFQSFYQATPQAAQIMGRVIPSPANPATFGPALMLFAAAIRSGDLQGWMGDKKFDMLQKLGKGGLVERLSSETSSLARGGDSAATDWKSIPIPLLWQNEISKIMFHVRKEPHENEREEGEQGTRFVMDLSLTRMGDVQLDGLVRNSRVDLIVRTSHPISTMMQEAMATAYAKALDGTNIYGELGFQSGGNGWETVIMRDDALISSI